MAKPCSQWRLCPAVARASTVGNLKLTTHLTRYKQVFDLAKMLCSLRSLVGDAFEYVLGALSFSLMARGYKHSAPISNEWLLPWYG